MFATFTRIDWIAFSVGVAALCLLYVQFLLWLGQKLNDHGALADRRGYAGQDEDTLQLDRAVLDEAIAEAERNEPMESGVFPKAAASERPLTLDEARHMAMELTTLAHDANNRAALLAGLVDVACLELHRAGRIEVASQLRARVRAACARESAKAAS